MMGVPRPRNLGSWDPPAAQLRSDGLIDSEAAVPWRVILWEDLPNDLRVALGRVEGSALRRSISGSSALMAGWSRDFLVEAAALEAQGFSVAAALLQEVTDAPQHRRSLRLPGGMLTFETTRIVGILNVTPDSFYDGGHHERLEAALLHAERLEAEGADVIEVGGEKAGPGPPVSEDEETRRVIPVIEGIRGRSNIRISVDTRTPGVARRAIEAGVDIVNDINGMRDDRMRAVIAPSAAATVIMHIQGTPRVHQPNPSYGSVIGDVTQFLHHQIQVCEAGGIQADRLIIDPGPGFGKLPQQDVSLMRHLSELRGFPRPLMLAISRKRFVGEKLSPDQRLIASLGLTGWAIAQGVELVRTHDVEAVKRMLPVLDQLRS